MSKFSQHFIVFCFLVTAIPCQAQDPGILTFTTTPQSDGSIDYDINLKLLLMLGSVTLLPALLMTLTSFTRIMVVLAILRQAIGIPNVPNNQILMGIAIILSIFIMSPVFEQVKSSALNPYTNGQINQQHAIEQAISPFKQFMLKQTRRDDLSLFSKISGQETPWENIEQTPLPVIMAAFITSELKTAFQIGFILFVPFLLIDLVVASVLMSLGMVMLSPNMVSLPFKLLLFVMVNGWVLLIGSLTASFAV